MSAVADPSSAGYEEIMPKRKIPGPVARVAK